MLRPPIGNVNFLRLNEAGPLLPSIFRKKIFGREAIVHPPRAPMVPKLSLYERVSRRKLKLVPQNIDQMEGVAPSEIWVRR